MNNKIKNVGIVLTTGVLFGFGTSAALADNIVGLGMYGTSASAAADADNQSDAVMWDDNSGMVSISYGDDDGLNFDATNLGGLIAVRVDAGGTGYTYAGGGTAGQVNLPVDPAVTGESGAFTYMVDGDAGAYQEHLVTVVNQGTGYMADNADNAQATIIQTMIQWTSANGTGNDCTTTMSTGLEAAYNSQFAGITSNGSLEPGTGITCTTFVGSGLATAAGELCTVNVTNGGVGYGDTGGASTGVMECWVNGELSITYTATYTADADGQITAVDMTLNGTDCLQRENIEFVPNTPATAGAGFAGNATLFGGLGGFTTGQFHDGVDCTTTDNFVAVFTAACNDCTLPIPTIPAGGEASFSYAAVPVGAITECTVTDHGNNYGAGPAPSATPNAGDVGDNNAELTAILGEDAHNLFYQDSGDPLDLSDGAYSFLTGADYNDDGVNDVVAKGASGNVYVYTLGEGGAITNELHDDMMVAGSDWAMVGQLPRTGAAAGEGHCILWARASDGAQAVWVVNGGVTGDNSPLEFAETVKGTSSSWTAACTNGVGQSYYYNAEYGGCATWYWSVDTAALVADWVTSQDYLTDGLAAWNVGHDSGWMIEAVGCLSGAPTDTQYPESANPMRDICWSNSDGGAAVWMMDIDATNETDSEHYFNVNGSDTTAGTVTSGNYIVGVGQNTVASTYWSGAATGQTARNQIYASIWWNRNGTSTVWRCDRTLSLQDWTGAGAGADSGTGLCSSPNVITAYQRY